MVSVPSALPTTGYMSRLQDLERTEPCKNFPYGLFMGALQYAVRSIPGNAGSQAELRKNLEIAVLCKPEGELAIIYSLRPDDGLADSPGLFLTSTDVE